MLGHHRANPGLCSASLKASGTEPPHPLLHSFLPFQADGGHPLFCHRRLGPSCKGRGGEGRLKAQGEQVLGFSTCPLPPPPKEQGKGTLSEPGLSRSLLSFEVCRSLESKGASLGGPHSHLSPPHRAAVEGKTGGGKRRGPCPELVITQ